MALDLGSWFKRIITLPKSRNSLSDVLGEEHAAFFKSLAEPIVRDVVQEIVDAAGAAVYPVAVLASRAASKLIAHIEEKAGREVSDAAAREIHKVLSEGVAGVPQTLEAVRPAIERALFKALKL